MYAHTQPSRTSPSMNSTSGAILDILPHIFNFALPAYSCPSDITAPSLCYTPLSVSHVCRTWRNIALRTPTLWTAIRFEVDGGSTRWCERTERWLVESGWTMPLQLKVPTELPCQGSECARCRGAQCKLEWLQVCVARSKAMPLDIYFSTPEYQDIEQADLHGVSADVVKTALKAVIYNRSRWRMVKIEALASFLQGSLEISPSLQRNSGDSENAAQLVKNSSRQPILLGNLVNAKHLSLHFYHQISFAPTEPASCVLDVSQSTGLHSVEFCGWLPQARINSSALSLSNVKRVVLHTGFTFGLFELTQFLASVPQIEELVAVVPHTFFRTSISPKLDAVLTLERLRILSLTAIVRPGIQNISNVIALLLGLATPALESLHFVLPDNRLQAECIGRALLEFIIRLDSGALSRSRLDGSGGLSTLELEGTVAGDWLIKALPYLPNLRSFVVNTDKDGEPGLTHLIEALSSPKGAFSCPVLARMVIQGVVPPQDAVSALLQARRNSPCGTSFEVHLS